MTAEQVTFEYNGFECVKRFNLTTITQIMRIRSQASRRYFESLSQSRKHQWYLDWDNFHFDSALIFELTKRETLFMWFSQESIWESNSPTMNLRPCWRTCFVWCDSCLCSPSKCLLCVILATFLFPSTNFDFYFAAFLKKMCLAATVAE